ncbi:MAG: hypothetical protein KAH18_13180, partial [Psychromonas sp.]|nr:hypothetical protein [Psychromonas sp.]
MLQKGLIVSIAHYNAYICSPLIAEYIVHTHIDHALMDEMISTLNTNSAPYYLNHVQSNDLPCWKMRLMIAAQTQDHLFESLALTPFTALAHKHTAFFIDTCDFENDTSEVNKQRFLNKSLAFQFQVLAPLLYNGVVSLENTDNILTIAEQCYQQYLLKTGKHQPMFAAMLAQQYLARNQLDLLPKLLSAKCAWSISIGACLTLLKGNPVKAIEEFELALKEKRKETKKRTIALFNFENMFYLLANIAVGNTAMVLKKINALEKKENHPAWAQVYSALRTGAALALNKRPIPLRFTTSEHAIPFAGILELCFAYWFADLTKYNQKITLEDSLKRAQQNNYSLFAEQANAMLAKIKASYLLTNSKTQPIYDLIPPICQWQRSLDALKNINQTENGEPVKAKSDTRMVWWITRGTFELSPREQKQGKKGAWTKGRAVSLKKLHREIFNYDYLTPQDLKICAHIQEYSDGGWYGATSFELNEKAIYAAIDHPHLYWAEDKSQAVALSTESPTLLIAEKGKNLKIALKPFPENEMNIVREDEYTLKLVNFDAEHHRIAEILTRDGLTVPASAKQQVLDSISTIAPFLTIHSDIGGGTKDCEEVESDKQLYMQISVLDEGVIKIAATICPLGELGPAFPPAQGSKVIMSEIQGKQLQTMRDLADESKQLASLSQIAPALFANEDAQWFIEDPQQALITIEAMQNSEQLKLVWQEGKKIKLNKTATTSNMSVKVGKKTDWFELSGSLQVDEDTILPLEHLLALISESTGRFIELEKGEYLALTEQLYQRLQRLQGLTRSNKKGLEFHPLASQAMDELS